MATGNMHKNVVNNFGRMVFELCRRVGGQTGLQRDGQNQNCDTQIHLGMPRQQMKVSRPILSISTLKLTAMEKEVQINNL